MIFRVRPSYKDGKPVPDLAVAQGALLVEGGEARLLNDAGSHSLPPLSHAAVTSIAAHGITIRGIERGSREVAQKWWVWLVPVSTADERGDAKPNRRQAGGGIDPSSILAKLSPSQRTTLLAAKQNDSGEWFVSTHEQGFHGLPGLGLALSRARANRALGVLGKLTPFGVLVRERLVAGEPCETTRK